MSDKMMSSSNGVPPKAEVSARETTPTTRKETEPTNQNDAAEVPFQMPEVAIEEVSDGEGTPITLGKFFGTWTAPWPSLPEQIMRAQQFTFHDSDVILLGYPKSGSHWMWEMIQMLFKGRAEPSRTPKERLMLSFSTQEFFDTLDPPRVFNCHAPFAGLPAALRGGEKNECRMVYVLRNPKDVAVSYYHHIKAQADFHYEGSFQGFLHLFLEGIVPGGSWFDYVLGWEETLRNNPQLPVLVLHYEDIKEDPVSMLSRVNEFLGLEREAPLLRAIAAQCTFAKMKQADGEVKDQGPQHVNVSKTGSNFIYRKGEVGDWRNWFTEADSERFERAVNAKLKDSKLTFRYDLKEAESTWL